MVDVRCGQADNLEEFGHEAETISGRVDKTVNINGLLNLTSS